MLSPICGEVLMMAAVVRVSRLTARLESTLTLMIAAAVMTMAVLAVAMTVTITVLQTMSAARATVSLAPGRNWIAQPLLPF